ncbi:MAG: MBL fold metallo-hydrolase [bacterium]|nr:MBL fold metallo-hydrolase [bacterium]
MKVTFIGTSIYVPDNGREVSSILIDGKHLVDTGWNSVLRMKEFGFDPLKLESLTITHFHQDHYIGLPQLLFYLGLKKEERERLHHNPLYIIGPGEYLSNVVDKALEFLQIYRFPELSLSIDLVPLCSGESYEMGDLVLEPFGVNHISGGGIREAALGYRFKDKSTAGSFVYTGDTAFCPGIAECIGHAGTLIHDVSHSLPQEAAATAKSLGAETLYLIHYTERKEEEVLLEARRVFPQTFLAKEGESLDIGN